MILLNLPSYDFKIRRSGEKTMIFDVIRKKYVVLTGEEWVRQNFIQFLIHEKHFPPTLMAIEMGFKLHQLQKRSDIVLFNKQGNPKLIIECKAPEVKITQDAFDQAARYNMALNVDYLVVTNGFDHYCCKMDYVQKTYKFLKNIPDYSSVN
jgi:hypothetical protein